MDDPHLFVTRKAARATRPAAARTHVAGLWPAVALGMDQPAFDRRCDFAAPEATQAEWFCGTVPGASRDIGCRGRHRLTLLGLEICAETLRAIPAALGTGVAQVPDNFG